MLNPDKWVLPSPEFRAICEIVNGCAALPFAANSLLRLSGLQYKVLALHEKSESYWLVGYYLSLAQSTSGQHDEKCLGEDYGVSAIPISRFRAAERWARKAKSVNYQKLAHGAIVAEICVAAPREHHPLAAIMVTARPTFFRGEIEELDAFRREMVKYYSIGRQMKTHILLASAGIPRLFWLHRYLVKTARTKGFA